jgi:hypothetical protein
LRRGEGLLDTAGGLAIGAGIIGGAESGELPLNDRK